MMMMMMVVGGGYIKSVIIYTLIIRQVLYSIITILIYVREHGCDWNRAECQRMANVYGHQNILEWINNN